MCVCVCNRKVLSFISFEEVEEVEEDQLRRTRVVQDSGCLPAIVNAQNNSRLIFRQLNFLLLHQVTSAVVVCLVSLAHNAGQIVGEKGWQTYKALVRDNSPKVRVNCAAAAAK